MFWRQFVRANSITLPTFFRKFAQDLRGVSALEFAMIAPALIFIIVGILQLGIVLNRSANVQWASERAAREIMLDRELNQTDLQALIEQKLATISGEYVIEVAYTIDATGPIHIGRMVVTYQYPVVLPLIEPFTAWFKVDTTIPLPS
jgi:hypothetical protein